MKPWPTPIVDSNGDYRNEMFLEEHVGGRLYEYQKKMPRLPIPSISDTVDRFLPTALPLARTEEEKHTLKEACRLFPEQAEEFHRRLLRRRDEEMIDSSWLQLWWNQVSGFFLSLFPKECEGCFYSMFLSFCCAHFVGRLFASPRPSRCQCLVFL